MSQLASPAKNKGTIVLEAIRAGGATRESLMAAAEVDKSGLASQLSYLNTRGLNIAEVDTAKAEFPICGEDGVFRMGTLEEYNSKKKAFGAKADAKPKTKAQVAEAAQKREDKASSAYSAAKQRADAAPEDGILAKRAEIRKAELELAGLMLGQVQAGNFSYETGTIVDELPAGVEAAPAAKGKNKPAAQDPGTDLI